MRRLACLLLVSTTLVAPRLAVAKGLGRITFPVRCSRPARAHFVRGVLALHTFFYDEARDEFVAAGRADKRCAMARWGEAMSWDETLWGWQDPDKGREALARARALATKAPDKERAFLDAAAALFGAAGDETSRLERVRAYRDALERMHRRWPKDDEITSFYALALLSSGDPAHPQLRPRMEAGALALGVIRHNPEHPGALHYAIHAFDDPDHAVLALPAARRLAAIAPESPHAVHMPAHIFVELGRWKEATAACVAAWKRSLEWVAARHHPKSWADFHSLSWLPALHVQLGQLAESRKALDTFGETVAKVGMGAPGYIDAAMAVARDAGRWSEIDRLLAPAEKALPVLDARWKKKGGPDRPPMAAVTRALIARTRALAAARRGDADKAAALCREMSHHAAEAKKRAPRWYDEAQRKIDRIDLLRVRAEIAAARGHGGAAEKALRQAIAIEDGLAASDGAQPSAASSYERLGELLLASGRAAEAEKAYAAALERRPGRSPALLGAARAATRAGHAAAAADYWRQLAENFAAAEPGFPGLAEARAHAKSE